MVDADHSATVETLLVTASSTRVVALWSLHDFRQVMQYGCPSCSTIAADQHAVAVGSYDGTITVSALFTGKLLIKCRGHVNAVKHLLLHRGGNLLVSGAGGFGAGQLSVKVWNLTTGERLAELFGDARWPLGV